MKYRVIESLGDADVFQAEVNEAIASGWQLYGDLNVVGVSSSHDVSPRLIPLYCQAVTKD